MRQPLLGQSPTMKPNGGLLGDSPNFPTRPGPPNTFLGASPTTGISNPKQIKLQEITSPIGLLGDAPSLIQSETLTHLPAPINNPRLKIIIKPFSNQKNFLSDTILKTYNEQNNNDCLTLLDGTFVYQNSQNSLSQLKANMTILYVFSDKMKNLVDTFKQNLSNHINSNGQNGVHSPLPNRLILGLPQELNPTTIENVLGYIHGNSIFVPDSVQSPDFFSQIYITAKYFNILGLLTELEGNVNNLLGNNFYNATSIKNLNIFVANLPPPKIFVNLPAHVNELPSNSVGNHSVKNGNLSNANLVPKAGLLDNPGRSLL